MKTTDQNLNNILKEKLIKDAQAFKKKPSAKVFDSIVQSIENTNNTDIESKSFVSFNWLIPSGFVAAALMLIMLNLIPEPVIEKQPVHALSEQKMVEISNLNINTLSVALESKLISKIQAEQKALNADFNYMKKFFTL